MRVVCKVVSAGQVRYIGVGFLAYGGVWLVSWACCLPRCMQAIMRTRDLARFCFYLRLCYCWVITSGRRSGPEEVLMDAGVSIY